MKRSQRKTAPEVRAGKVRKKNNWEETPSYDISEQPELIIDRKPPGNGCCQLLTQADVRRFISIIPDCKQHSRGLNAVVLAPGDKYSFGFYKPCFISLCAWPIEISVSVDECYYRRHIEILDCLNVSCSPNGNGQWMLDFTEDTARAYLLLSTFLHELGHHNDYMNTRKPENANRGESHAEEFALRLGLQLWPTYQKAFRL